MHVYSVHGHGRMIADQVRIDAYVQALRRAIQPDSIVLDLGTGTGIFALLACRFGARRVYAIEPSDIIQVARENAAASGWAERIEFIQNTSSRVTLPERADMIISDLRGLLPWFEQHIPSIVDARQRLLVPGGILIPQRDTVWAGIAEAPDSYHRLIEPWVDNGYDLDLQAVRHMAANNYYKVRIQPEQLLTGPQCLATLDYPSVESPDICGELTWIARRSGTAHGLILWFDTTLAGGVHFSNSPGAPELIYGTAFFPWSKPVSLDLGDIVCVGLEAKLTGGDYIWRWETCVRNPGRPESCKARFQQSTFLGEPLSPEVLRKLAASHVPELNEEGRIDQFILALIDGQASLGEIASRLADRFPSRFVKWQEALTRVGELSQKYSR